MKKPIISLGTIVLWTIISITTEVSADTIFADLDGDETYFDSIIHLADAGIVNGYPDGTFQPQREVNRAEMMKILVESRAEESFFAEYHYENCFPDVPEQEWYTKYICYGKAVGWIVGYDDGTFRPAQTITFVEALKIALKSYNMGMENTEPWYKYNVVTASEENYIPYTVSNFDEPVTRAVMSDLAARIKIKADEGQEGLDEFLGDRAEIRVTYETMSENLNLAEGETLTLDEAQNCPETTELYRNENKGYEFCHHETGSVDESDLFGVTFSFSSAGGSQLSDGSIEIVTPYDLSLNGYLGITRYNTGIVTGLKNFTNSHGTTGLEYNYLEEETNYTGRELLISNTLGTKFAKIGLSFPEENEIAMLEKIRDTFKFLY